MSRARIGLRIGGIVLVVGVVVALGVAWFLHNYEKVENELHLPPRGEAAYNPLYALKQTLQADGVKVASRQRLDLSTQTLAAGDTLLILNDPRTLTPVESRRLLEWVASGGHLLVRTPVPGRWDKDMQIPLFKTLGVRTLVADTDCEPFQVEGEDHHVEFCRGRRFTFDEVEPLLSWGDLGKGYVYARLGHGEGQVDVLADFDFLANNGDRQRSIFLPETDKPVGGLRDGPHRALARQVLAPNYGKGTMHLVYAAQMPSLWRSVLQQGWPVWAPLLLALLAWLASRAQRFGPWLPSPLGERRSLLEHVRASGEHLSRYNKRVLLYAAVRNAFLARLRRRDPVSAALSGEPQVSALSARLGLAPELIRAALQTPASYDKATFRERVSTLIHMRNHL